MKTELGQKIHTELKEAISVTDRRVKVAGYLNELIVRVYDAEKVISKIGLCGSAPHEARERYERKYGKIE